MPHDHTLLFLELNEVNFNFLESYIAQGHLPNFAEFFRNYGYAETTSERRHEELEPWIQWVTAHTGLSLSEHGIFRLGDIVSADFEQIWDRLAQEGLKVGAISPMNAKCRAKDAAFFVPDPWTQTDIIAAPIVKRMVRAIVQAVGDNAEGHLSGRSLIDLSIGAAAVAAPAHYSRYISYIAKARSQPWLKAVFLDQLLSDLFIKSVRRHRPNFASLFLNAAAHIQHHYMFSSSAYTGAMKNPEWYVPASIDPLLDVYTAYDKILGDVAARFPDARIMLATGLHQDPHPKVTYYWRLKDHNRFLKCIGADFANVEALMSRDFLVKCNDSSQAANTSALLESAIAEDGEKLFEVDNRGTDIFAMLTYGKDITPQMTYQIGDRKFVGLDDNVAFVAIKNGQHNGIGYFSDSGAAATLAGTSFPLSQMPSKIAHAFDIDWLIHGSKMAA